jgi:hypothetical protein
VGGGGNGVTPNSTVGVNGAANTGGGGGGSQTATGSNGGSGIVVIRYPGNTQYFTGGTVACINNYVIHKFTSSGTLTPTTPTKLA